MDLGIFICFFGWFPPFSLLLLLELLLFVCHVFYTSLPTSLCFLSYFLSFFFFLLKIFGVFFNFIFQFNFYSDSLHISFFKKCIILLEGISLVTSQTILMVTFEFFSLYWFSFPCILLFPPSRFSHFVLVSLYVNAFFNYLVTLGWMF